MNRKAAGVLVVAVTLALSVTAEEHEIGSWGATVELSPRWERRVISPDLGPDQFYNSGIDVFTAIIELDALLGCREDLEDHLDQFISGIELVHRELEKDDRTWYEERGEVARATRRMIAHRGGIRLAYQIDVVGRHGLGYMVLSWGSPTETVDVYDWASRVARSIQLPPEDSEWGRRSTPAIHTFRFGGWDLQLAFRDSELRVLEEDEEWVTLVSAADEVAVHACVREVMEEVDCVLEGTIEAIIEGERVIEIERADLEWADGQQASLHYGDEGEELLVTVGHIPVGEDRIIDLRLVSSASIPPRDELWRTLVESAAAIPPPELDAFPMVESTDEASKKRALDPATEAVLAASEVIGTTEVWNPGYALRGQEVLVHEGRRIVTVGDGATEAELVATADDAAPRRSLAVVGDQLYTLAEGPVVARLAERSLEPTGVKADVIATLGGQLLLARREEAPTVVGFDRLPNPSPTQVIVRSPEGDERTVLELPDVQVDRLAGSADGRRLLMAVRHQPPMAIQRWYQPVELIGATVSGRERQSFGDWQSVEAIVEAADGWLVSGTPDDGPLAVYHLADDASRDTLVAFAATVIAVSDDHLVFASSVNRPDEPGAVVYSVPMEVVRRHGPHCRPFSPDALNRIAAAAAPVELSTAEQVERTLRRANEAALEMVGTELPATDMGIDTLLTDLSYETSLTQAALELLSVLIVDALLDGSEHWVGDDPPRVNRGEFPDGDVARTLTAVGYVPRDVVESTLYDEDGWWRPLESIRERADGRPILLGNDPGHVRAATEAYDPVDLMELVRKGRWRMLRKVLADRTGNLHLRSRVYDELAARGHLEALAKLAAVFVSGELPAACDVRAALAARLHTTEPGDGVDDELIADLRAAIAEHPEEPSLYLLLGMVYERCGRDNASELARACYEKCLDLRRWGPVAEDAEKALERLAAT